MANKNISSIQSKSGSIAWINITNAGDKEIDYLKRKFKFDAADLADSYAKKSAQRAKFNQRNSYSFFILQFPAYNKAKREIVAEEVDFFLGPDYLITLHKNNLPPLPQLFSLCNKDEFHRDQYLGDGPMTLFHEIVLRLQEYCFPILDHISEDIKKIDDNIFNNREKEMLREIMVIKRNIINAKKILDSHKNAIQKIITNSEKYFKTGDNLKHFYLELLENTKNIWEIVSSQKEFIESLEDVNTTLVSFRINQIMRTLTVFSVIVFPLTLFAAIFGMNTVGNMPFLNHPYGFWIIIAIMAVSCISMFAYFKHKDWL